MIGAGNPISGSVVAATIGLGAALYVNLSYMKDGGFHFFEPPRYRPDLLNKEREANPYEPPNLSMRQNRIPLGQTLLSVDRENLHLYGIK